MSLTIFNLFLFAPQATHTHVKFKTKLTCRFCLEDHVCAFPCLCAITLCILSRKLKLTRNQPSLAWTTNPFNKTWPPIGHVFLADNFLSFDGQWVIVSLTQNQDQVVDDILPKTTLQTFGNTNIYVWVWSPSGQNPGSVPGFGCGTKPHGLMTGDARCILLLLTTQLTRHLYNWKRVRFHKHDSADILFCDTCQSVLTLRSYWSECCSKRRIWLEHEKHSNSAGSTVFCLPSITCRCNH